MIAINGDLVREPDLRDTFSLVVNLADYSSEK
jgi:hypothetical protein